MRSGGCYCRGAPGVRSDVDVCWAASGRGSCGAGSAVSIATCRRKVQEEYWSRVYQWAKGYGRSGSGSTDAWLVLPGCVNVLMRMDPQRGAAS